VLRTRTPHSSVARWRPRWPRRSRGDVYDPALFALPFPIGGPAQSSWREQALGRAAEYRFLARLLLSQASERDRQALLAIERHLDAAERAASGRYLDTEHHWRSKDDSDRAQEKPLGRWDKFLSFLTGASLERVNSQLDAVETDLLRLAPDPYLRGALPNLCAHVRNHLPKDDPRRARVEEIAQDVEASPGRPLVPLARDQVLFAVREASLEARREIRRVRSFRNVLLVSAVFLMLGVAGITVLGVLSPERVPMCFAPDNEMVVCPTKAERVWGAEDGTDVSPAQQARVDRQIRRAAGRWDIPIVEIAGLLAAALASALALRSIQGTSTPYSLPVALAVLKLPSGALTAVLGLLLMRGGFIPGLSALDSSAQIIAWAIVFGYAQQLLTRFLDQQANQVLENVGNPSNPRLAPNGSAQPTT
jgi:hypothetical protein